MKGTGTQPPYRIVGATLLALLIVFTGALVACGAATGPASRATTGPPAHGGTASSNKITSLPAPTAGLIPAKISSGHAVAVSVADGVAYLGTADNAIYALHMNSGAVMWRQQISGSVITQPLIANGMVYISSYVDQNGPGYIYALQASNGKIMWRDTSSGYPYITPGTDGSTLYLAAPEGIEALQASNGEVLWRFSTGGIGDDNPVVAGAVVYATLSQNGGPGTLAALNASNGRLLWHYQAANFITVQVVTNGVLYFNSGDGTVGALRASNGQQIWQRKIDANLIEPLRLLDGVIYTSVTKITYPTAVQSSSPFQGLAAIGSLFENVLLTTPARAAIPNKEGVSSVYAIRASDGAILWHYPLLNGQNSWTNWFSAANGAVYVSAFSASSQLSEGDIYALQSSSGALIWHDKLQLNPFDALLANGIIYLSNSNSDSSSGAIYAIRAEDGAYLWSYPISGNVSTAPVMAGTTLYVGAGNGMAYALQAGSGTIMWHYQTDVGI